jgi:hypothetical protein
MQIVVNNHMQAQLRLQYIECEVPSVYDIRLAGPGRPMDITMWGAVMSGSSRGMCTVARVSHALGGGSLSCSV